MALLELVGAKQRRTTILSETDGNGIVIDAVVAEEHGIKVDTTEHPVERGANVSDHRRVKPDRIKLKGIMSNYPVKLFASAGGAKDYVINTWDMFKKWRDRGDLVTITTSLETYESMMIEDVTVPRDSKRGNVLEFDVIAKRLRIVDSEEVPAPEIDTAAETPKPESKNLGTKTPAAPEASTLKSFAAEAADKGLGGVTGVVKSLLPIP